MADDTDDRPRLSPARRENIIGAFLDARTDDFPEVLGELLVTHNADHVIQVGAAYVLGYAAGRSVNGPTAPAVEHAASAAKGALRALGYRVERAS